MELIFATNNKHKLEEISHLFKLKKLDQFIELKSLKDIGFRGDIPETGDTLEYNALEKATYIQSRYGSNCFADDTGLMIDALNGAPGVYSARYAGENCSFQDNVNKVLKEMQGVKDRKAHFETVISVIMDGSKYFFKGEVHGKILETQSGEKGFGYDPVFLPEGYDQSFAEMSMDLKNSISHRARAFLKFVDFLGKRFTDSK